jgi:hypothetical protein
LSDPFAESNLHLRRLRRRVARAEDRLGECVEPGGLGQSRARGGKKIGEKLLGVCLRGPAVDAQRVDDAALRVFELSRVARGAGQSELARCDRTINDEADRQAFRVCRRDVMGEIAVAQQFVGGEGLVDIGALERLEPGIGHQVRALARRIERFAIRGRPALRGVREGARRAGLLRPPLDGPNAKISPSARAERRTMPFPPMSRPHLLGANGSAQRNA